MFKNVVFDLDGTIVSSNHIKQLAILAFARSENYPYIPTSLSSLRHLNRYKQCQLFKGKPLTFFEKSKLDDYILSIYTPDIIDPGWFPLSSFLISKNLPLSVVSALPNHQLRAILYNLGILSCFHNIGTGSTSSTSKSLALSGISYSHWSPVPYCPSKNLYIGDF